MQISFAFPQQQFVAEPIEDVIDEIRLYASLGMYRAGKLSIGAACELAGVDRYIFLDFCRRENVPLQTQSPDELESDFQRFSTQT